jgi:hypothetical protein
LLRKDNGQVTSDRGEIEAMASNFFKDLYTADRDVNPQEVLPLFEPKISAELNEALVKDISEQEISDALFQVRPLIVPGPEALNSAKTRQLPSPIFPKELGNGKV